MARAIQPAWHNATTPALQSKRPVAQPERKAPAEMLTLTLGDFLDRIPGKYLDGKEHDPSSPLPFDLAALSERLGRGDSTIPVSEIFRRIPDVFRADAVIAADLSIRFPWRKVLAMVTQAREGAAGSGLTANGAETLALKLKARKFRRPMKMAPVTFLRPPSPAEVAKAAENFPDSALTMLPPSAHTQAPAAPAAAPAAPVSRANPPAVQQPASDPMSESAAALQIERLNAQHAQEISELAAEKDRALEEIPSLRLELANHLKQTTAERRMAIEVSKKLSLLQNEHEGSSAAIQILKDERDAAVAHAAEIGAEHEAAIARTGRLAAERDAALARAAEIGAGRDPGAAAAPELLAERDAALTRSSELIAERDAALTRSSELTAERDAALTRSTELTAERDAALTRSAELTAERDAALTRSAELTAERDAALTRSAELTAERDAALTRSAELTAERDAATARAEKLIADSDAAIALASELTAERDAAVGCMAAVTSERDAALARVAEITAERDASVACAAELLKSHKEAPALQNPPDKAEWESGITARFETDIAGYRNRIQDLMHERDTLRQELGKPAPKPSEEPSAKSEAPGEAASLNETDAYSALFPQSLRNQRQRFQRIAAAVIFALLGIGIVSQVSISTTPATETETGRHHAAAPVIPETHSIPPVTEAPAANGEFTLETPADESTISLLPIQPLLRDPGTQP